MSARPLRVVLDTNVVLSALVFAGGAPAVLREAWRAGSIVPLVSAATASELVGVLGYPKFRLSPDERQELLADYLPYAETIRVADPPPAVPACRDRFDLPFLHLAVAGRAGALVSGDADLLGIARVGRCPIVSPAIFVASLGARG